MVVLNFLTRNFNYVFAILLLASFIPGIKFAPRRQLHEEKGFSIEAMTSLKGIMALFVLFHHISQKPLFRDTGTMSLYGTIGFLFVAVFFFCSGYGLYKSFITKENYLDKFPKKRILPIVISYFVMIAIYAVYYLIIGNNYTPVQWALKLTGLILINSQSWFVYIIVIMYFAFYLIYKNEKAREYGDFILLTIAIILAAIFIVSGHTLWWLPINITSWIGPYQPLLFMGEWWFNSTIAFALGVTIAKNEKAFFEWAKKGYWLKFVIITCLFIAITVVGIATQWDATGKFKIGYWYGEGAGFMMNRSLCFIIQTVQVLVTCLFVIMLMQKVYVSNKFYKFYGKRSLEVYLIQEMILFSWNYLIGTTNAFNAQPIYKFANWNIAAYAILVFLTVSVCAIVYHWINQLLTKPLKK